MLKPIVKRSDLVRTLNSDTVISWQDALVDRIEVDFGDWVFFGSADDVCDAMSNFRNVELADADGQTVNLFNNH